MEGILVDEGKNVTATNTRNTQPNRTNALLHHLASPANRLTDLSDPKHEDGRHVLRVSSLCMFSSFNATSSIGLHMNPSTSWEERKA